jgi:hypothetical protein
MGPETREGVFTAPVSWFPVDEEVGGVTADVPAAAEPAKHKLNLLADRDNAGFIKSVLIDGHLLRLGVPVKVEKDGAKHTYEFVRAWVDEARVTHVEFKLDGKLLEVKRKFTD